MDLDPKWLGQDHPVLCVANVPAEQLNEKSL